MKIADFDGYEVFEDGSVLKNGKFVTQHTIAEGYKMVSLSKDNKSYNRYVHRLVAQAFIDNPKNKKMVNHIDGIKTNNHVSNLEWVTATENKKHAMENGLTKNSSGFPSPVLKYTKDGEFVERYPSMLEAAYQHKCSYQAIKNACIGKSKTCKGYVWRYEDVN